MKAIKVCSSDRRRRRAISSSRSPPAGCVAEAHEETMRTDGARRPIYIGRSAIGRSALAEKGAGCAGSVFQEQVLTRHSRPLRASRDYGSQRVAPTCVQHTADEHSPHSASGPRTPGHRRQADDHERTAGSALARQETGTTTTAPARAPSTASRSRPRSGRGGERAASRESRTRWQGGHRRERRPRRGAPHARRIDADARRSDREDPS